MTFDDFRLNTPVRIRKTPLRFWKWKSTEHEIFQIVYLGSDHRGILGFDFYYRDGFAIYCEFRNELEFNRFIEDVVPEN
jgi:hypothetical protein